MNSKKKKDEKPLTKKELRRLEKERKLEEERKAKEAEEARIAEERRLYEEELERKRQEELAYQQAEAARLKEEAAAGVQDELLFQQSMQQVIKATKEKKDWEDYLMCQETVNIEREQEINMFIVMLEESGIKDFKEFEKLLDGIDEALELVRRIHLRLLDCICTPDPKLESSLLRNADKLVELARNKCRQLHSFVLHAAESIVAQKLKEIRAATTEAATKSSKSNDNKPEVQITYKRRHVSIAYWIMAFENSGIRPTPIDLKDLGFMTDLPKAFFSKKLVLFGVKFNDNMLNYRGFFRYREKPNVEHQVRSQYWPVEGFVEIGCLNVLPESKELGDVVVKRLFRLEESLQFLSIPTMEGASTNFRIYFFVADSRRLEEKEDTVLCYWDQGKNMWSREGLGSVFHEINDYKRRLMVTSFVPSMAPFCMMQPIMIHMPYNNFVLRRISPGALKLDIMTTKVFLSIKIRPKTVTVASTNLKCLAFLHKRVFTPSELLLLLAEANVLLIPRIHDLLNGHRQDVEDYQSVKSIGQIEAQKESKEEMKPAVTEAKGEEQEQSQPDVASAVQNQQSLTQQPIQNQNPPTQSNSPPSQMSQNIPPSADSLPAKLAQREKPVLQHQRTNTLSDSTSALKQGIKSLDLAEFVTDEICRNVTSFYIQLSKFNCQAGYSSVILSVMENPGMIEELPKESISKLKNVHFTARKCELLKISEESESMSFERYPNTVSHLNLKVLCNSYPTEMEVSSQTTMTYTEEELLLMDTLRQLIRPMDLIAFSN